MVPQRSTPTSRTMRITSGRASLSSGASLRLPGATTNGAITLHRRSQKATTLSPFTLLWPLKPRLSPPFFRRRCRAVAMNDRRSETAVLMKPRLVKTQLRCRTAATDGEMRQDKLLELRQLQLRRNRLPPLSFRHSGPPKKPSITRFAGVGRNLRTKAAYSQIQPPSKTRNQLSV
jgi:hypothetical protein